MAQGQHVGKLVVTWRIRRCAWCRRGRASGCARTATYLITGGLGGLGLAAAALAGGAWRPAPAAHGPQRPADGRRGGAGDAAGPRARAWRWRRRTWRTRGAWPRCWRAPAGGTCPARGVLHCAGVLDDGMLEQQEPARFAHGDGAEGRGRLEPAPAHPGRAAGLLRPLLVHGRRCWARRARPTTRRPTRPWTRWRTTGAQQGCRRSASTGAPSPRWVWPRRTPTAASGWRTRAWRASPRAQGAAMLERLLAEGVGARGRGVARRAPVAGVLPRARPRSRVWEELAGRAGVGRPAGAGRAAWSCAERRASERTGLMEALPAERLAQVLRVDASRVGRHEPFREPGARLADEPGAAQPHRGHAGAEAVGDAAVGALHRWRRWRRTCWSSSVRSAGDAPTPARAQSLRNRPPARGGRDRHQLAELSDGEAAGR